jgi:hypothetical protein
VQGVAITGFTVQDGSAGFNYPTGVTGIGQLNFSGYWAFGSNFIGECFTTGGCVAGEDDANQWHAASNGVYPPDYSGGGLLANHYAIGRQAICSGNFNCYFAFGAGHASGVGPGIWDAGFYTWPDAVSHYGIFVDGSATKSPQYSAYLKNLGTGSNINLILQTTGAFTAANKTMGIIDSIGTAHYSLYQDGTVVTTGKLDPGTGTPGLTACGGSPVLTALSNNTRGSFTVGTAAAGGCTLTFSVAYTTDVFCSLSQVSGAATAFVAGQNLTGFVLAGAVNSAAYSYVCLGS